MGYLRFEEAGLISGTEEWKRRMEEKMIKEVRVILGKEDDKENF